MSLDGTYVRVCPQCGGEFVSSVETCFDCGAALETRLADAAADPAAVALAAQAPGATTEPPAGWVAIQTADLDWAIELRDRLAEAGVAARLAQDCASCRPTLGVFVPPESLAAAEAVARAVYVEKVPEAAAVTTGEGGDERCPACGGPLARGAAQCPECGLAFGPYVEPPVWG